MSENILNGDQMVFYGRVFINMSIIKGLEFSKGMGDRVGKSDKVLAQAGFDQIRDQGKNNGTIGLAQYFGAVPGDFMFRSTSLSRMASSRSRPI